MSDPKTYLWPELVEVMKKRHDAEWATLRHAYQTNLMVRLSMGDWPELSETEESQIRGR